MLKLNQDSASMQLRWHFNRAAKIRHCKCW